MEKKKLKIVFLNITQGAVNRGAEIFVENLKENLKNHHVEIITDKRTLPKRWPVLWRFFLDPQGITIAFFTIKNIPRLLRGGYDVILPVNGGWQGVIVKIVSWFSKSKVVISGQSGMGYDDRVNLFSFPDIFISLSMKGRAWAKKINPFVTAQYIPNGVDLEKFNRSGKVYKTKLTGQIVLCVSALIPQKRIKLAIKAVSKTRNMSLLVVGEGDLKDEIFDLGRNLLRNRFELISLPHDVMPEVYRAADVFTLPSESSEAFGIVLVEAMACGLPVVATNDTIRKEIVGDAGFLVDPENINDYSKALQIATKNNWGLKPQNQAKKFSWKKIALEYEKIFKN